MEPEKICQEMMVVIGDSLSDLASSDDGEDGEDEDDEVTEQGQVSEDDEPAWVMGTITKPVQQCMGRFRQKPMKIDILTHPGWDYAADYSRGRDQKYNTSALRVPAVVKPQTDDDFAAPVPTIIGELMEHLDIVPGISQMPQGTSQLGSSHIMPGSQKQQSNMSISGLVPAAKPQSWLFQNANPVELTSYCPCVQPPQLITI